MKGKIVILQMAGPHLKSSQMSLKLEAIVRPIRHIYSTQYAMHNCSRKNQESVGLTHICSNSKKSYKMEDNTLGDFFTNLLSALNTKTLFIIRVSVNSRSDSSNYIRVNEKVQ